MMQLETPVQKQVSTFLPDLKLSARPISQKVEWTNSFLLNEAHPLERDHLFNNIAQPFLLDKAVMVDSLHKVILDKYFVVSTFSEDDIEFVSMLEGKRGPIFGYMYSPQKSQFTSETMTHVPIE